MRLGLGLGSGSGFGLGLRLGLGLAKCTYLYLLYSEVPVANNAAYHPMLRCLSPHGPLSITPGARGQLRRGAAREQAGLPRQLGLGLGLR